MELSIIIAIIYFILLSRDDPDKDEGYKPPVPEPLTDEEKKERREIALETLKNRLRFHIEDEIRESYKTQRRYEESLSYCDDWSFRWDFESEGEFRVARSLYQKAVDDEYLYQERYREDLAELDAVPKGRPIPYRLKKKYIHELQKLK